MPAGDSKFFTFSSWKVRVLCTLIPKSGGTGTPRTPVNYAYAHNTAQNSSDNLSLLNHRSSDNELETQPESLWNVVTLFKIHSHNTTLQLEQHNISAKERVLVHNVQHNIEMWLITKIVSRTSWHVGLAKIEVRNGKVLVKVVRWLASILILGQKIILKRHISKELGPETCN